uniref:SUN domain-containing protein n=1 Tax=Heterorhabditis bacteriophora TaxID=37862 RepID=A0A1I7WTD6_HETBA
MKNFTICSRALAMSETVVNESTLGTEKVCWSDGYLILEDEICDDSVESTTLSFYFYKGNKEVELNTGTRSFTLNDQDDYEGNNMCFEDNYKLILNTIFHMAFNNSFLEFLYHVHVLNYYLLFFFKERNYTKSKFELGYYLKYLIKDRKYQNIFTLMGQTSNDYLNIQVMITLCETKIIIIIIIIIANIKKKLNQNLVMKQGSPIKNKMNVHNHRDERNRTWKEKSRRPRVGVIHRTVNLIVTIFKQYWIWFYKISLDKCYSEMVQLESLMRRAVYENSSTIATANHIERLGLGSAMGAVLNAVGSRVSIIVFLCILPISFQGYFSQKTNSHNLNGYGYGMSSLSVRTQGSSYTKPLLSMRITSVLVGTAVAEIIGIGNQEVEDNPNVIHFVFSHNSYLTLDICFISSKSEAELISKNVNGKLALLNDLFQMILKYSKTCFCNNCLDIGACPLGPFSSDE